VIDARLFYAEVSLHGDARQIAFVGIPGYPANGSNGLGSTCEDGRSDTHNEEN
jgi:hypothetical protein